MLCITLVRLTLHLLFGLLAVSLFERVSGQGFVAAEGGVSIQELIVVHGVISNAQTSKSSVSKSADFPVSLVHEQVSIAVGEAMVEHASHPVAHMSLFHAAHLFASSITWLTHPK